MSEAAQFVVSAVVIGIGATIAMDLWAVVLQLVLRIPPSNWGMVGRWVGHFPKGQFVHSSIAQAAPIRGELAIGWIFHYLTGITYGVLMLAIWGLDWARQPTLAPALVLSLAALVAPFFLLQPGMGLGVAGSKTPNPTATRVRSVLNHIVFGLGLYVTAVLMA